MSLPELAALISARVATIRTVDDPVIGTLRILRQALILAHALLGTTVPRAVEELSEPEAFVGVSKTSNKIPESEDDEDDDLTLDELAERARENRTRQGRLELPRMIRLEQYGSKPKKISVAHNYEGEDMHLYALVLVSAGDEFKYMEARDIAATGNVAKRLEMGEPLALNTHYLNFEGALRSNFVITVTELYELSNARTSADVARANSARPVVQLPRPEEEKKATLAELEGSTYRRGDDVVTVNLRTLILNRAAQHLLKGTAVACTNMTPHSCTTCVYVHTTGMKNSWVLISGKFYLVSGVVPNAAFATLRNGTFRHGVSCTNNRPHDVETCTYIHLHEDAKPANGTSVEDVKLTLKEYQEAKARK